MKNNKHSLPLRDKAFTLIEMLVVISLIGILTALALASFTSSQKQARDVVRKSDLKQYQTLLESYANMASGFYPSKIAIVSACRSLCPDLNIKFEPDTPCLEDPKYDETDVNSPIYKYISNGSNGTPSATVYVLWAKLENKANTYWVVCSNGKNGESASEPTSASCPATLN